MEKEKKELLNRLMKVYNSTDNQIIKDFIKFSEVCDDLLVLTTIVKAHEQFTIIEFIEK